jgi:acyl-CoA synthetase (AMP-forming)/AMP-acid ligase II
MTDATSTRTDAVALETTAPGVLRAAAAAWPTRAALETPARQWTFAELWTDVQAAARAFHALGLVQGERIAIWAPNQPEWILAALGAQCLGAALVPLNTRLKGREAADILRRSRVRVLVTVEPFLGTDYPALLAGEALPDLRQIVRLAAPTGPAAAASAPSAPSTPTGTPLAAAATPWPANLPPLLDWNTFLAGGASVAASVVDAAVTALDGSVVADILFTSGTTGSPKGVVCTHGQNTRSFRAWAAAVDLRPGDRYLIVNPFFHAFGYKSGWLVCLLQGATALPMAVFDAGEVMRRIVADRITVLPGPPTIFQSLLAHPDRAQYDLSSLRVAVTGAASVPPVLIQRMRDELGFSTVLTGYGLTESTGLVSMCRIGDSVERVASTCGVPIPGIEVRLVTADGSEAAPHAPGELWVRGFNVMQGYLDDPEGTAEAIDADGWLHTGDIAVRDDEGYLRITDRMKDMYICGGFNCYPAEIERLLSAHPAVAQVAVLGIPDERLGEVGRAVVVRRPGTHCTATELVAWCRSEMANYKVPREVLFVDSLPVNAAGKVTKFQLKAWQAEEHS